ncbi:MAG: hypothetical protein KTR20_12735 [Cellvibrionaceae bacterium]|nr:hypothetical protein [Cellvibrionaceae bacterium]
MSRIVPVSEKQLAALDEALGDVDLKVASSMLYIKDVQKWNMDRLSERLGLKKAMLYKYMQPGYVGMRPIHVIAAYSWVTMVLMTSFLKDLKVAEVDRGADSTAIEAIIQCGRLPKSQFQTTLDYIYNFYDESERKQYDTFLAGITEKFGSLNDFDDQSFLPPKTLDVREFGDDYYYSLALVFREFRIKNGFSIEKIARVLGLSPERYEFLEEPSKSKLSSPFCLRIGIRVRMGFHMYEHVEFTKHMRKYPEFHTLRVVQHIRDSLLVEALRLTRRERKASIVKIMEELARNYASSYFL